MPAGPLRNMATPAENRIENSTRPRQDAPARPWREAPLEPVFTYDGVSPEGQRTDEQRQRKQVPAQLGPHRAHGLKQGFLLDASAHDKENAYNSSGSA